MTLVGAPEPNEVSPEHAAGLVEADLLRAELAKMPLGHPRAAALQQQINERYAQAYPSTAPVSVVGGPSTDDPPSEPVAAAPAFRWPEGPAGEQFEPSFQRALEGWDQHSGIPRAQTQALINLLPTLLREAEGVDPETLREDSEAVLTQRYGAAGMERKLAQAEAELEALPPAVAAPIKTRPGLANAARVIEELSLRWEARARAAGRPRASIL